MFESALMGSKTISESWHTAEHVCFLFSAPLFMSPSRGSPVE